LAYDWPTVFLLGEATCVRGDARYLVRPEVTDRGALGAVCSHSALP
jgi:hypothetical protein